mmetsp:Transcript_17355/g.42423  ORF Transcript_17355/g.42423 Transcript_17355/m.42423 type:complete len:137 (+) Transcript_17355:377-787(+)
MSAQPFILRVVYTFIPRDFINKILPPNASFGRQAAVIGGGSFVVGASMEMFMIKTGFYEVATRKEAERRAIAQWELEEAERLRQQEQRKKLIAAGGPEAVAELRRTLEELRERERHEHVELDKDKYRIKAQLRRLV